MGEVTTYVGIDAHQKDLFIAMLVGPAAVPVTWIVPNEPSAIRKLVRTLEQTAPGPIHAWYEAGPCGYALQRQLQTPRLHCDVIAPSLVPRKPGERVKTNRRDARKLAELLRAGLLTVVRPPTPEAEAVRDLCRARDDVREDLQRARHRVQKLLLRRGLHYRGKAWTRTHRTWLRALPWAHAAEQVVMDDYLLALEQQETRLRELDAQLQVVATTAPYAESVAWLRCFRGIDTLTAILLLAELHDLQRFPSPRALMAFVGLVPSEASSGETYRRGRITRTGNTLVRRLLVEAAWHYQHRATVGVTLARRRAGQPGRVIAIADRAQQRLCRRFRALAARQLPRPKIAVSVARELSGFLWATRQVPPAQA
jgi:transposase